MDLCIPPPEDGNDSDLDDAPSEDEDEFSIRDIGQGVLKQSLEVVTINKEEKHELQIKEDGGSYEAMQEDLASSDNDDILPPATGNNQAGKKILGRVWSQIWYWPFVRFCLNGRVMNMWNLYRFVHPKKAFFILLEVLLYLCILRQNTLQVLNQNVVRMF